MYLFDKDLNPVRPPEMPEDMPIFGWFAPLRLVYRAGRFDGPPQHCILDHDDEFGWCFRNDKMYTGTAVIAERNRTKFEAYGAFLIYKDVYGTEYARLWRVVGYLENGNGWMMYPDGSVTHTDCLSEIPPPTALGFCMVELGVMENPHVVTLS